MELLIMTARPQPAIVIDCAETSPSARADGRTDGRSDGMSDGRQGDRPSGSVPRRHNLSVETIPRENPQARSVHNKIGILPNYS